MQKVAVFGNAGGGKSTLARQLAVITGLPLHVIDQLQFKEGGVAVPHDEYLKLHRDLLSQENWIIDGYGDTTTVLERCGVADTLIHVDLSNSLLVGDKASNQRSACRSGRLAKGQPALAQHDVKLQGHPALQSISDAEVPATRHRNGHVETCRSP
jgi:hypothetical protein